MNPDYPVYIISKGRWESRLTAKCLHNMGVSFSIVVEKEERENYEKVIKDDQVLVLDDRYKQEYDACCKIKKNQSKGSGPARNFVWDHAASKGAKRHWIMDDNIRDFLRLNRNRKIPLADGTAFKVMEDFADRYKNIALAGPHYSMFAARKDKILPAFLNTRLFSCILIKNDIPFRWRARYNEDLDLSLRVLKAGWCTIQFNMFLQAKISTQKMKGGNTDELYARGTKEKSEMIARLHPDVCYVKRKFSRIHHEVDFSRFKRNKLILKDNIEIPEGENEYGMILRRVLK